MRNYGKGMGSLPQRRLLASAISVAVASWAVTGMAAQSSAVSSDSVELNSVTVKGQQEAGYKVDKASSPKYTAPLLDTPQTIAVVPQKVIEQQQALSLRQVLSNVSGITFTAGEGGGGSGSASNKANAGVFTATGMTGNTTSVGWPASVAPNARAAVMIGMT